MHFRGMSALNSRLSNVIWRPNGIVNSCELTVQAFESPSPSTPSFTSPEILQQRFFFCNTKGGNAEDSLSKVVLWLRRSMSFTTYLCSSGFSYPFPAFLDSLKQARQALPIEILSIHYSYLASTLESTIYSSYDYSYSKSLKLLELYFSNFIFSKKMKN